MSPSSTISRTFLAMMSLCWLSCLVSTEFRAEKPKELLRHQQNRRPPFIDRRLTLESRIQRYADESDVDYSSATESTYIETNKSDDDAAIVVAADPDDEASEDKDASNYVDDDEDTPETSLEKPLTQIRHGRSRGRFARPITKLDDEDSSSDDSSIVDDSSLNDSPIKAAIPLDETRLMADDASATGDVRYNNNNNDTYPDFDFEDAENNLTESGLNGSSGVGAAAAAANQSARTRSAVSVVGGSAAAANQSARTRSPSSRGGSEDSRRFSELSRGQTWLDSSASSGRVKSEVADARDIEASGRRADSFEKLRKVVAGSRGHGKGYKNNNGGHGGGVVVGEISDFENSTRRRTDIDGTRNADATAADSAVGGYGVVVHGIRDADDATGSENGDADRGGRNSSVVRADYEDYWDIGDAAAAAAADDADETEGSSSRRPDKQQSVQVDIVTRFLRIIENQHLLGENCTAGTDLNLGEGVVDQYAQERFRLEANLAVNRANMLTRLWKYAPDVMLSSEYLLHASILSMVEFDEDIFAAGNCYDKLQYRERWLYCPFAHRLQDQDGVLVKDLAVEYKYLSNSSEWFYIARKNAERVIASNNQFSRGYHTYTLNESTHTNRVEDEILTVKYEDGRWSKPYYDCGGGNIWMLTYTVPFFGYTNDTYFFKGTSGIDIDLRRVDIDQCPLPIGSTQLNIFAASDKCKSRTTECIAIPGLGFRRGSYRCVCKRGYYYPDTKSTERYYNGTVIEEEYEKLMLGEDSQYSEDGVFECLPCAEGCEYCEDGSPCVVSLNWLMRTAILILECCIIACLPVVILFTWKFGDVKVVRAASPVLLRVIVLGAFFIYCTTIVMYPRPNVVTCTIRVWLREIGFSLTYGALMLKTWRISVIFRVKSAKAVKITDMNLLKRLGIIVTIFAVFLGIRTLVAPPVVIVARTADDLKAYLCRTDWWDHSFTTLEVMFLVWGIRLCIVVRKAPSEFNESRFISMAIYNEFLLSVFLNVSMLFLQSPANPDLLYIIFFCHTQLTVTLLLCLIFGSKAYVVFRGGGKEDAVGKLQGATGKFIGKTCRTQGTSNQTNSISLQQGNFTEEADGVTEEFRRLYAQLELLKEKNMRLGNRHLVTKIQAMQEASSRAETQVSTIQTISSSLRLSVEQQPCSSTIEETEVSSRIDSKSAAIYHHQHRPQDAVKNHSGTKKSLESKNETNAKTRNQEGRTDDAEAKCTCSKNENQEAAAVDKDDEDLFAKKGTVRKDDNVNHETVAENGDVAVDGSQISRSLSNSDNVDAAAASASSAAGPGLVASSTRTKEAAAAGNYSGSNNGAGAKERGKTKSGHARTHAIVINLDDKSRFSEEVTV